MRRGILMGLCLLGSWLATAKAAEGGKRVLLVHSYGSEAAVSRSVAFETELAKRMESENVYVDQVYVDHARYPETEMEEALVDYLEKRVAKWQPDLVVPMVSPACVFVAQHRERLFPRTPVLYAGMDRRRLPPDALQNNAAFVGQSFNLPGFVEDILQLAPETTNIVCVIGASRVEQYWAAEFQSEFARFTNRVGFTWLNDLPFDQMLERAKRLPPRSFVFLILMIRDAAGVAHDSSDALKQICEAANAPVNSIFENQLGLGIVGGRLYSYEAEGVATARIAFRILRGEPASSFSPVIIEPVGPQYDWRELRRWGIAERSLPPGSIVQFREKTIWERYRAWILAGISVLVAEGAIIASLIVNLRRRRRAEEALARGEREARSQLGQLSAIYRATPTGLAFLDNELRFVRINDHLARINRLPAAAHIGRTMREILGNFADEIEPTCRRVIEQGEPITDLEVREREAGVPETERVWLASYHPVKNEGGSVLGVSAVVKDITARKHEEETLRNIAAGVSAKTGETFFESLAEHISSALQLEYAFVCELCEGGACARTVASYVNGKAAENINYDLAGTPCEQVLRLGMAVYPHGVQKSFPEDTMLVEIAAESYLGVCLKDSTGKALGLMAVMSRKPLAHIEAAQSMLSIFAARASAELERKQDEDRLRAREQDLRVSEERYREVVESQTDLVCRFLPDGTVTFVNGTYCRFLGYPREKIIGRKFFAFIPKENRATAMEYVATLNKERRAIEGEHEVILPDGHIGWQHWVNYPIMGGDGEVTEFQGIGRDITDRKRAEEAAREARGRLIHAQEDERRRIARDLHDDVNQQLALLLIEMELWRRGKLESQGSDHMAYLADRIRRLSSDVHRLSHNLHPAKLDQLGLVATVRSLCREMSQQSGMRIHFSDQDVPREMPDHLSLCVYRVLQEGLQNMVRHSGAREAEVRLRCASDQLDGSIADAGKGFDLAAARQAGGLGLVSMEERVRLAHGSFAIHSRPGRGTRIEFKVPLPKSAPPVQGQSGQGHDDSRGRQNGKKTVAAFGS